MSQFNFRLFSIILALILSFGDVMAQPPPTPNEAKEVNKAVDRCVGKPSSCKRILAHVLESAKTEENAAQIAERLLNSSIEIANKTKRFDSVLSAAQAFEETVRKGNLTQAEKVSLYQEAIGDYCAVTSISKSFTTEFYSIVTETALRLIATVSSPIWKGQNNIKTPSDLAANLFDTLNKTPLGPKFIEKICAATSGVSPIDPAFLMHCSHIRAALEQSGYPPPPTATPTCTETPSDTELPQATDTPPAELTNTPIPLDTSEPGEPVPPTSTEDETVTPTETPTETVTETPTNTPTPAGTLDLSLDKCLLPKPKTYGSNDDSKRYVIPVKSERIVEDIDELGNPQATDDVKVTYLYHEQKITGTLAISGVDSVPDECTLTVSSDDNQEPSINEQTSGQDHLDFSFTVTKPGNRSIKGEAYNCGGADGVKNVTLFIAGFSDNQDAAPETIIEGNKQDKVFNLTYYPDFLTPVDINASMPPLLTPTLNKNGVSPVLQKGSVAVTTPFTLKEIWWYGWDKERPLRRLCLSNRNPYGLDVNANFKECQLHIDQPILHVNVEVRKALGEMERTFDESKWENFLKDNIVRLPAKEKGTNCCYGFRTPTDDPHIWKCTVNLETDSQYQYGKEAKQEEDRHAEQSCQYLPWKDGGIGETYSSARLLKTIRKLFDVKGTIYTCDATPKFACQNAIRQMRSVAAAGINQLTSEEHSALSPAPPGQPAARCWVEYTAKDFIGLVLGKPGEAAFHYACAYLYKCYPWLDFAGGHPPPPVP